ncbi:dTDP-4-dehydrorhamnose 3,5-epimerase [Agrobacterium rosae]|uniref:dTDP-4-dehydrorhamnose 3,5-epimerase n=1 Tax=Agrobacterium rosae TaxID=1972867 RepID=UPI000CD83814|nr:dTDP-4-dehydrorhamnose 3,5-epimerase [Agrobacterium rosae]POO52106.1 dTDP-4-dehydrorhamnose 3,5-epimerase [Agrobacterium rosae]
MELQRLPLEGLTKITPRRIGDNRGYFSEVFRRDWFEANILDLEFVQDNESLSQPVGTVRGLHFQLPPFAQGKLVRCISGRVFDVAVDIRKNSPTFGKWYGVELSMVNGVQLWIPPGFAHGFATLEENSILSYKVTAPYSAEHDRGVLWNDPDIGIEWPVAPSAEILSDKDRKQPRLSDISAYVDHQ